MYYIYYRIVTLHQTQKYCASKRNSLSAKQKNNYDVSSGIMGGMYIICCKW